MLFPHCVPTSLEYFASLVHSDEAFPLFEAAVSLGQDEYPQLDVQGVLDEVDRLLVRVRGRMPGDAAPLQKLRILNQFFFHDLRFAGNVNDFYDPDNSFIHMLLSTRRGIPVSLALLWIELAQGVGLKVAGVGFPGHFMVKVDLPMGQSVIDPMTGKSLSREALSEMLEPFSPRDHRVAHGESPLSVHLRAAPPREIVARMLRNLKDIYRTQEDWRRLLTVQERLVVLLPQSWDEYRDRGLAHAELGNTERALADLECYMVHSGRPPDIDLVTRRMGDLRRAGP